MFSGGQAMQQTGDTSSDTERSAAEPPLPVALARPGACRPRWPRRRGRRRRGAARPAQEEQDFQALKRRIDKLVKEAGLGREGLHHRVPARLEGQAAHGRPLLRLGQRGDQHGGAPDARPDRRDHRRRGARTRSRSRATRTTGPSPPRSSRPTGSFPARAPGPSCSASAPPACPPSACRWAATGPSIPWPRTTPSPGEGRTAGSRSS